MERFTHNPIVVQITQSLRALVRRPAATMPPPPRHPRRVPVAENRSLRRAA